MTELKRTIKGFSGQVSIKDAEKLAVQAETTSDELFYMMGLFRFEEYMAVVLKTMEKNGRLKWNDQNDKILYNYLNATAAALLNLINDNDEKMNTGDEYDMRIVRAGRELALKSKLIPKKNFEDLDAIENLDTLSPSQSMMSRHDRLLHPGEEFLTWED